MGMSDRVWSRASDERLLAAVGRGQEAALRELHRRHAGAAMRFAWRMLDDAADAEDAVAEAFCDLWRQAPRFDGGSRVRTWLLGIVRHKALDLLRRRGTARAQDEDEAIAAVPADDDPQRHAAARQEAERVVDGFRRLAPAQREALYLAVVEGLTVAEIAQIQGVPQGTVATRIHHARRRLRACLEGRLKTTLALDDLCT